MKKSTLDYNKKNLDRALKHTKAFNTVFSYKINKKNNTLHEWRQFSRICKNCGKIYSQHYGRLDNPVAYCPGRTSHARSLKDLRDEFKDDPKQTILLQTILRLLS